MGDKRKQGKSGERGWQEIDSEEEVEQIESPTEVKYRCTQNKNHFGESIFTHK